MKRDCLRYAGSRFRASAGSFLVLAAILILPPGETHAAPPANTGATADSHWQVLAPIPDPIGYAGMAAGVVGSRLCAAGGSHFEDKPLWLNGTKTYSDRVFLLDAPDAAWREADRRLPFKAAYFGCAGAGGVTYVAGGVTASGTIADVLELRDDGANHVAIAHLPSLPRPLGFAAVAVANGRLYAAGGKFDADAKLASREMWSLGLIAEEQAKGWRREPDLPEGGTTLACMGFADGGLFLFGGVEYQADGTSIPSRAARRFDLQSSTWEKLPDMPGARIGPCSPCPELPGGRLWVIGGYSTIFKGPPSEHPGFDRDTFVYDIARHAWESGPILPRNPPLNPNATGDPGPAPMLVAPSVTWRDRIVFIGGEVRASVRTPAVLSWPIQAPAPLSDARGNNP